MNHNILSFFKHIFVGKNIVFNNLTIVFGNKIYELLTTCMIKSIWHLIRVNPVLAELLSFFLKFLRDGFGFDLLKYDIVFNNLFVFEKNSFNLMKRMLIDLELLRNCSFLFDLIDIFLYNKFHRSFTFLLMFFFFFLKFDFLILLFIMELISVRFGLNSLFIHRKLLKYVNQVLLWFLIDSLLFGFRINDLLCLFEELFFGRNEFINGFLLIFFTK